MIRSMTGFARRERQYPWGLLAWELKTVNHRYLEVGCRLPEEFRAAEADFRTRMLVRRPSDPQRFSGTVVVEWNNVSAGIDASPDWILLHRHLAAQGHAWVGMSAQKAGIDGGGAAAEEAAIHVLDEDTDLHPDDWF